MNTTNHHYLTLSRLVPSRADSTTRPNTAAADAVSSGVSMATAGPGTSPVRVKKEKIDSPPASPQATTEVTPLHRPRSLPFSSMARLGYFSQNQADATTRMTEKLIVRFQCSVCSKTFSRSGTLKVNFT